MIEMYQIIIKTELREELVALVPGEHTSRVLGWLAQFAYNVKPNEVQVLFDSHTSLRNVGQEAWVDWMLDDEWLDIKGHMDVCRRKE